MTAFSESFRSEVARIARKENKGEMSSLRKTATNQRAEIATLKRDLKDLAGQVRSLAKALQKSLRDTDFIARFGGEEFVVLLPNVNPDKFETPLENLRKAIKSIPFRFRDARVEITISIGATLFKEGDQPSDAFERADKALYGSKNGGRDRVNTDLG